jgi:hypothetical protein
VDGSLTTSLCPQMSRPRLREWHVAIEPDSSLLRREKCKVEFIARRLLHFH